MRGYVPTPVEVVDRMVDLLFATRAPRSDDAVLDPGCGPGAFIDGVLRWCARRGLEPPHIVGVELDPGRHAEASRRFRGNRSVEIVREDFLRPSRRRFDFILGNPPYVSITEMSEVEKAVFRAAYQTARGRFDLYLLFFEQALSQLRSGGRLVYLTPEKFLYVKAAEPLRRVLAGLAVREIALVAEDTFGPLVTYPAITVVDNSPALGATRFVRRDGTQSTIALPQDGSSVMPALKGHPADPLGGPTLEDLCLRISCGVATGADDLFVFPTLEIEPALRRFAHPTISGRQLTPGDAVPRTADAMLIPYDHDGGLLPLARLGEFRHYLSAPTVKTRLEERVCARRKPWYAFHDSVPFDQMLRPKILCKDITAAPHFWIDRTGEIVPRHSVYYIVPKEASRLDEIAAYLNGPTARTWLFAHCQRAANDFLRLQSAVLKQLPMPADLAPIGVQPSGRRRRAASTADVQQVLFGAAG